MKPANVLAAILFAVCSLSCQFVLAQDTIAARNLASSCFTCHGLNGNSVGAVPPSLAGRDRAELLQTMKDFKSGKRPATIMHQQAKGYTDQQLELIAGYFAAQKSVAPRVPAKP